MPVAAQIFGWDAGSSWELLQTLTHLCHWTRGSRAGSSPFLGIYWAELSLLPAWDEDKRVREVEEATQKTSGGH